MIVLGIESSCDETAAALVREGRELLATQIASSAEIHRRFGGVVPEIASRLHVESILPVVDSCIQEAGIEPSDIGAIAVTHGPGLAGALLVGLAGAKGLASVWGIPLLGVHHIASHMAANYLADPELKPPYLCLVVSGGHSQLIWVRDYLEFEVLGSTRDDAAGEAFDKVARVIGLPYPGGPELDRLARNGNPQAIRFPRTRFGEGSLDFSFSGVKTAALTYVQKTKQQADRQGVDWHSAFPLADFAASYQEAILQPLIDHAAEAIDRTGAELLVCAGGVSANHRLRLLCQDLADRKGIRFFCPPLRYCTDNAAMVASMGYYVYQKNPQGVDLSLDARTQMSLQDFVEEVTCHAREESK